MPKDMKMEDLGKCHHAISIPGCKYEIGIIQKNDHLVIAYDAFDRNLAEAIGAKAAKFNQYYEAEHVRAQFRANGYIFHESKTEDGTLTYHAAKTKEELLAFANGA